MQSSRKVRRCFYTWKDLSTMKGLSRNLHFLCGTFRRSVRVIELKETPVRVRRMQKTWTLSPEALARTENMLTIFLFKS
jgi:hypothetical protein